MSQITSAQWRDWTTFAEVMPPVDVLVGPRAVGIIIDDVMFGIAVRVASPTRALFAVQGWARLVMHM